MSRARAGRDAQVSERSVGIPPHINAGGSVSEVIDNAAQLPRDGTLKDRERAIIYQAVAVLPGIRITDDQAVLDGRKGTAIGLKNPGRTGGLEIIIDPLTGRFIGQRDVTSEAEGSIPAGTTMNSTAVTTSVVENAR